MQGPGEKIGGHHDNQASPFADGQHLRDRLKLVRALQRTAQHRRGDREEKNQPQTRPVTTRGKHPPAEIIAAAREHMAGINDRKVPASRNLKLVDFVEQVFLPSIKQEQRPSTHQSYAALWALHIKPHATDDNGREMWLQRVRTPDCQRWLKAIAKDEIPGTSTRLSLNSLRRVKSVISGIFATARAPGLLRRHQSGSGHED
jgi:hypothetical protein